MDPSKTTKPAPLEPVQIAVVGVGETSEKHLPSGTVAVTPDPNQPNLVTTVVTPLLALAIRFGNLFGTTFVGLVVAAFTPAGGKLLYTSDVGPMLLTCASLALPAALLGLFKDIVTIFGRLETKFPLLTGKV